MGQEDRPDAGLAAGWKFLLGYGGVSGVLSGSELFGPALLPFTAMLVVAISTIALLADRSATRRARSQPEFRHRCRWLVGVRRLELALAIASAATVWQLYDPGGRAKQVTLGLILLVLSLWWLERWSTANGIRRSLVAEGAFARGIVRRHTATFLGNVGLELRAGSVIVTATVAVALFLSGSGWAVAASYVPALPSPIEAVTIGISSARGGAPEIEAPSAVPVATPTPTPTPTQEPVVVQTVTVTPSPTPSTTVRCDSPAQSLRSSSRPGRAMFAAWSEYGANEVGCPHDLRTIGDLHVADLDGGESAPALVVSDQLGRAAVVFEELVGATLGLLNRGRVAWIERRRAHGLGDYQVFHLRSGSCILATRATFGDAYILVPPVLTRAVVEQATRRGQFPLVVRRQHSRSPEWVDVRFDGNLWTNIHRFRQTEVGVNIRGANEFLRVSRERSCPELSGLELLAKRLESHVEKHAK